MNQIGAVMEEYRSFSFSKMMGCFSCFGFDKKQRRRRTRRGINSFLPHPLMDGETDGDEGSHSGDVTSHTTSGDESSEAHNMPNRSEEILNYRAENGMVCRRYPVKETTKLVRSEVTVGVTFISCMLVLMLSCSAFKFNVCF